MVELDGTGEVVGPDGPVPFLDLRERAEPWSVAWPVMVEVLGQIGLGRTNDEIASELYISPATARTYVSRLLTKLHSRDRAQLVVIAYQTGLVQAP